MADQSVTPQDCDAPSPQAAPGARAADASQELLAMLEIAKALAAQPSLEALLATCLRSLVDALDAADAGMLLVYAPDEGCLKASAAQGYDLAVLRQLRLAPGEAMSGMTFVTGEARFYPTPDAVAAAMANLTPANREIFNRAVAGGRQPLSAICVPLTDSETRLGVLVLESLHDAGRFGPADLTFLQQVASVVAVAIATIRQRQAEQAAQAISEANRLKAELISTLAHEMRTPLTSIKGYASALLMEEATFSLEAQRESLQFIDRECDLLQGLVHDILESSVIDAGLLELSPQPVLLPRLIGSVIAEVERGAPRHSLMADLRDLPIVEADVNRVAQVLRNLLDNAVKYSPEGSLIVVRGEVRGDQVVISVADQGMGIAPEHLSRLFDKFFRVKSSLGRHIAGTGLGLPIVRTIVEGHGGRVWAESRVGHGSTFYFTLPLERDSD
ncbi:MAG TPA: GAF domain-containing sensor histidine kinase [Anaerolineae bacterium]|nr:GAF domain-containing sensor histidine kinase [Anaerolineae bacterium]HPL27040.1 GAF domain-containing sensor histidine kinase [Anaerolineae bacterium]